MLNKVFLQGRLVADPELRHTSNGVAMASFRVAVDRDFKDRETGERKADFISVVAWRQTAEFVSRFLTKGRMAIVEGKLQTRDYTDRDGNRRFVTEVVADNVYFGDSRRDGDNGGGYAPAPTGGRGYGAPAGGGYGAPGGNYPSSGGGYSAAPAVDQFADLTDDDGELPF
ncbi:MAG: single-stranded DNA-binding protein [Ruminiclostridium sp.]|jgi:single-strand DNA-binding protein|nr:single-stranded DNA-binding protein [Ruminiclostridium sp.]MBR5792532.1 single-stranded DNA-binding protein [Ruminiclostridium sp.]